MISGIAGFLVAVSVVSAGLFALMTRAENRSLGRVRSRSGSSFDGGGGTFDTDSSSVASWFGFSDGGPNGDCGSSDGGSSDSGGGDCGGGGDGGGGGGD